MQTPIKSIPLICKHFTIQINNYKHGSNEKLGIEERLQISKQTLQLCTITQWKHSNKLIYRKATITNTRKYQTYSRFVQLAVRIITKYPPLEDKTEYAVNNCANLI
jgi:hypothetical protein